MPHPHKISLATGCKWLRLYRMQYKVRMTPRNVERLQAGAKLMGRPVPRLVSIAGEDAWQVPLGWTVQDVQELAAKEPVPYFAARMDGEYIALRQTPQVLWCIAKRRIHILPVEELAE